MQGDIESRAVGFSYGKRRIFEELSFKVEAGTMVAVLGANGVGKTTLLNLISGLLHPASGEVSVGGRDVGTWKRSDLARYVSLVPQHLEVPFQFRVEEIVSQGRVPYAGRFGGFSSQDREVVNRAMQQVDVFPLRDRVFAELSGGERQRVKIAIALAQEPKIMLLDEPTQHLDIGRQIEVLSLLRRLNEGGITVVAAVHDLSLVGDHFSRVILLMERRCRAGTIAEVMRPDLLAQAFRIGSEKVAHFCEPAHENWETDSGRMCRRGTRRRGPLSQFR